jgi:hypothetical protein
LGNNEESCGEAGPEFSSEEELMAKFRTVRKSIKPKKWVTEHIRKSSDREQNTNKSQNHNQAKERMEQGSIREAEPEAQSQGN